MNLTKETMVQNNIADLMRCIKAQCETECKLNCCLAGVVQELSMVRDSIYECGLSKEEINFIINDICIS